MVAFLLSSDRKGWKNEHYQIYESVAFIGQGYEQS